MRIITVTASIKSSVQKINLVADLIRKRSIKDAQFQLYFCNKIVANYMRSALTSALFYSRNNFDCNTNNLFIEEIKVFKSLSLKRSRIRAKGRMDKMITYYSKVCIILKVNNKYGPKN